jgi:hypothetical protein
MLRSGLRGTLRGPADSPVVGGTTLTSRRNVQLTASAIAAALVIIIGLWPPVAPENMHMDPPRSLARPVVASNNNVHHASGARDHARTQALPVMSTPDRRMRVAVTVLMANAPWKTPDIRPTLDGLLVLQRSVTDRSDHELLNITFVALVMPDVEQRVLSFLKWAGWVVEIRAPPLEASEVRNKQIAKEIVTDGAIGIAEMCKVYGFVMTAYDRVVMVDADVFFHQGVEHVLRDFDGTAFSLGDHLRKSGSSADHPDVGEHDDNDSTQRRAPSIGWTKGGWVIERINGGFLVFNPHSLGERHFTGIVDIVKEGDFRSGTGWRGSGIGWTYGGRTIQGVLPYYFFDGLVKELAKEGDAEGIDPSKVRNGSFSVYDVKLNRCRFNNMVQLEECKVTPYEQIVSNHFTGSCTKPWTCGSAGHPLCSRFVHEWWKLYDVVRLDYATRLGRAGPQSTEAQRNAAERLRSLRNRCHGGYQPMSESLIAVAMEQ